ncbi:MAG: beta-ketoacyl-ACP synthase III [Magnetospiraceae bacterium]
MGRLISQALGCGSYLPETILTNEDLAKRIDTSDEWIRTRTGIGQRHVAAEGETTGDLATEAAKRALDHAGITVDGIDLLIVATTTPDNTFPATATIVQERLGMYHGAAFDVQAVCSGFVYGMATADSFIRSGQAKSALVIGAETFTRLLDWEDRGTCVLFGDGAGAVVLRATEVDYSTTSYRGILSNHIHSDGRYRDLLYVDGGPSKTKTVGHVRMVGKEVFRHAVTNLAQVVGESLEANGLTADQIDWVIPHQANRRILDSTARKLQLPAERFVVTVDRHANTSAASIPLALDEAVKDGRIQQGQLLLLEAMGGGFTWGATLLRW